MSFELNFDNSNCINCGECVEICVPGALSISNGLLFWNSDECRRCETCVDVCPTSALTCKLG